MFTPCISLHEAPNRRRNSLAGPITRIVEPCNAWHLIGRFSRVITAAIKRPKSRTMEVAIVRTDTIKPARIIDAYRRILWRLHTDRLPSVRFAARFSARYSHSMTSLAPLDQSRSGLCQNRSRSAIGIILLSDWFWLATLIREQRWCVALSRVCRVERCELVGLRPSLRNLIIWLDYHHVLPPFSLDISSLLYVSPFVIAIRSFIDSSVLVEFVSSEHYLILHSFF